MDCKTRAHKDVHHEANTLLHHSSPSSSSSSPNHDFSFTISLHPVPDNTIAVDLSPADDIFFHGHLLPLHLISHLPPASPRSSTTSTDPYPFPAGEKQSITGETEPRARRGSNNPKPRKPFSLFRLPKWRKGSEPAGEADQTKSEKSEPKQRKQKQRFDMIKRYARMVFSRKGNCGTKEDVRLRREPPCSFSGDLTGFRNSGVVSKEKMMLGMRGIGESYSSAPASMRTSPANSGLLVAEPNCSTADSTMEELQAAIQAAIAHCKSSIAAEEKRICHTHHHHHR